MSNQRNIYFYQLDGIRFLAVSLVVIDHWAAESISIPLGALGVTIFFVLSGFLITRILIISRDIYSDKQDGLLNYLKKFFLRRTIRIFPIYYLTIIILYFFNISPVRKTIFWNLTYTNNLYIVYHRQWLGIIDHFWSLAVEEQVYIFMPFAIFFLYKRKLINFFILLIVLSVSLRLYFYLNNYPWFVSYVFTVTCFDSFALGGLMAYCHINKPKLFTTVFSKKVILYVSVIPWLYCVYLSNVGSQYHNLLQVVFGRLFGSVFGAFLIGGAVLGYDGSLKNILVNPISKYLGKISYGIYTYQNFVYNHYHMFPQHPTARLLNKIFYYIPSLQEYLIFKIFLYMTLTISIATASWYIIERPINSLKEKI